eukprot:g9950.t1
MHAGSGKDGPGAAAFRVQSQIRRNAQDMQDYLTELGSWEKSIKKKDRQISRKATARSSPSPHSSQRGTGDTESPPVRPVGGVVPVSPGPAPRASQSTGSGGDDKVNGGAASPSPPGEVSSDLCNKRLGGDSGERNTKGGVSAAGHTYDKGYSKWAKFDIDAALRSVDEEDAGTDRQRRTGNNYKGSDSDTDGDDTQEAPRRLTPATMVDRSASQVRRRPPPQPAAPQAAPAIPATKSPRDLEKEERERGNAKFGQGDFEAAVKCYTRCVGMNSKSSLAFSNRAMAYLKLKEFGKAEADCDSALRVDPRHVKSLQRRAAARNALGKHRAALADLQTAAEIDPSSKQVRKDLSKTLETLKTVVRRAPKRAVRVESAPLPAPKPRGYSSSPPIKGEDEGSPGPGPSPGAGPGPGPAHQAGLDDTAVGAAVSATNTSAPVTGSQEETVAPFSSVLREGNDRDKDANGESNVVSYQARTTVEELPEGVEEGSSLPAPSSATSAAPANATASGRALPATAPSSDPGATPQEGQAAEKASRSAGIDGEAAAAGLAAEAADTGVARPAESETVPARDDARRPPVAAAVSAAVAATGEVDTGPVRPAVSPAAESRQVNADAKQAGNSPGVAAVGDSVDNVPREAPGETAPSPLINGRKEKAGDKAATPALPPPTVQRQSAADTRPSGSTTTTTTPQAASQLPTTGYQFELMWRSADGSSPEARLELLRAVPPSSVAKFFRRTPIEVDLLGGVLRDLGEAFLPRKPATALRWLKSLSKACRFGMTVALLGEADGRAAAREVLARLEAAPPTKVDPRDVDALRKQFLV